MSNGPEVVFSWEGWEVTLLGLEFFKKVMALEPRYKQPNQQIENDLPTNGTLRRGAGEVLYSTIFWFDRASMAPRNCTMPIAWQKMAAPRSIRLAQRFG